MCAYPQVENYLHNFFYKFLQLPLSCSLSFDALKATPRERAPLCSEHMKGIRRFRFCSLKSNFQLFTEFQIPKSFERIPPKQEQHYADNDQIQVKNLPLTGGGVTLIYFLRLRGVLVMVRNKNLNILTLCQPVAA